MSKYCLIFRPPLYVHVLGDDQYELFDLLNTKRRSAVMFWPSDTWSQDFAKIMLPLDDDEAFKIKMKFSNWKLILCSYEMACFDIKSLACGKKDITITPGMFFGDKLIVRGVELRV